MNTISKIIGVVVFILILIEVGYKLYLNWNHSIGLSEYPLLYWVIFLLILILILLLIYYSDEK